MSLSFTHPVALWALLILLPLLALPFVGRLVRSTRLWVSAGLRLTIGLLLILALAGVQLVRPVLDVTTVFVLDLSDSVPVAEQARAETFIREAVAGMPAGGQAGIVAFGGDALVERLASAEINLPAITSAPRPDQSDIASALRLGMALFPESSQKRLVLLSDGLENVGRALKQAELATANGVEVSVVPLLAPSAETEAFVAELQTPANVRQGQSFILTAIIESTVAQAGNLFLLGDGRLLSSQAVSLQPGTNRIQLSVTAEDAGFQRYRVELQATLDTLPNNNLASGFTVVYGPPQVLIAEGTPGEGAALAQALISAEVSVTRIPSGDLPGDLPTLSSYDAVMLVGVAADQMPEAAMKTLPIYVRDLGRGLVMVGGEESYGAGGYLRSPLEAALPVDMEVRNQNREPNVAMVLAVDKSGSMGRCHCDDPNSGAEEVARVVSGLPKVDIAKEAILQAAGAIGSYDYLGVVAFDENALWAHQLQRFVDLPSLQTSIGGISAEGQTNIFAGLRQAEDSLIGVDAKIKHIILLTDGWSRAGAYDELTTRLRNEGITLSVVAAGGGSADYLSDLAEAGGGRFYASSTMEKIPQIFLKETIQTVGSYVIEEPFYPLPSGASSILRGLNPAELPVLQGYNGTTAKQTAQVSLLTPRGDPLLAQWQYGLGRSVAWTSDLKGQWASDWIGWEAFDDFVAQLVGWTLPQPADEQLQVQTALDDGRALIQVDSAESDGTPRDQLQTEVVLINPALGSQSITLDQTAVGRYAGSLPVGESGAYLLQVVQRNASGQTVSLQTSGLVVPYSAEYKRSGQGEVMLRELPRLTGGSVLESPAASFAPTAQPAVFAQQLWPWLLLLAALLFPIDVGVRRLRGVSADLQQVVGQARERLPRRRPVVQSGAPVLGELFKARDRVVKRPGRTVDELKSTPPVSVPDRPVEPSNDSENSAEDTLSRLRQARNRAKRRR